MTRKKYYEQPNPYKKARYENKYKKAKDKETFYEKVTEDDD